MQSAVISRAKGVVHYNWDSMARLHDVMPVFRRVGFWAFVKRIIQQIIEDNVTTLGAAMAYAWLFAIFPFMVLLLSLVPFLPHRYKPDVKIGVDQFIKTAIPSEAMNFVRDRADEILSKPPGGGFLSFGILLTIWAASKGMSTTMRSIDIAYDVEKMRPFYRQQPLALILTVAVATMVVLVLILMPVGTGVLRWLIREQRILPSFYWLINVCRYFIAILLLFSVLAIIYHFGPSFSQKFVPVTPGAIFSVVVWVLLGEGFRLYMTRLGGEENYNRVFGTVAGVVILLLFFYIDAVVLLIGAEINSEIDFALTGVRGAPAEPGETAPPQEKKPVQSTESSATTA